MISLFRLAKSKYINDLSGVGAKLYGGRWNPPGLAAIYTSSTRSLAALEVLAHTPMSLAPPDLSIVELRVPETVSSRTIALASLPPHWGSYPAPHELPDLGEKWLVENKSLLLYVPSVLISSEAHVLINPAHPESGLIKIHAVDNFKFDHRLIK